jgi:hypothetical protein
MAILIAPTLYRRLLWELATDELRPQRRYYTLRLMIERPFTSEQPTEPILGRSEETDYAI